MAFAEELLQQHLVAAAQELLAMSAGGGAGQNGLSRKVVLTVMISLTVKPFPHDVGQEVLPSEIWMCKPFQGVPPVLKSHNHAVYHV